MADLVFGEVAAGDDEVRPGYPAGLRDVIAAYCGAVPSRGVEIGAGTGKATVHLAPWPSRLTCLEPDPSMAAVLRRAVGRHRHVDVVETTFERWAPPPGGVDLLLCFLAWHWIPADRRWLLAAQALRPGGVVALGHRAYRFADLAVADAVHAAYDRLLPELRNPDLPPQNWITTEMDECGSFGDQATTCLEMAVELPTSRYLELLQTFSPHLRLARARREPLYRAIADVLDARGGTVALDVDLLLTLGRRRSTPPSGPGAG